MKELPDPDCQSTIRSRVSKVRSRSVNRLANPGAISSANIQNGFGGKMCSLLSISVIAIRKVARR